MNITLENSPELWGKMHSFWLANHRPGKFYYANKYYLALRTDDLLIFVPLDPVRADSTSLS